MRTSVEWIDQIPDRNGQASVVNAVAFRPDGSQLIAAVGDRVLIYDPSSGNLIQSLKGHKDTVYAVDYARNGKRFASGGADHTVIIWTNKGEGILKYTHTESIQCLAYNPTTQALVSCSSADYGIWSPEQKSVAKTKVVSKILTAAWNAKGVYLALGMFNGWISIRDTENSELCIIERKAPVWCCAWNPSKLELEDTLAVGCWDQTLSLYSPSGTQQGRDRTLDFFPCSLEYLDEGKYLVLAGSNRKATLYTREGTFLADIRRDDSASSSSSTQTSPNDDDDGWIWTARARPQSNELMTGSNHGRLSCFQLSMGTVHGIYENRYAVRENMTDVVIQHLMTEQKVRIKARDLIQKIAVYRDRLAIQLSDRVIIYELTHQDSDVDMHYRVRARIPQVLKCSLFFVTSGHVILGSGKTLSQLNFTGTKEREWTLESAIRYIKVLGGPPGREGLVCGLASGAVVQIFLNHAFPIVLISSQTFAIRCLDVSPLRDQLALVNDQNTAMVYDLASQELMYELGDVNSVAYNTESNDMLSFSGQDMLRVKTGHFPVASQRMPGHVVGFAGSKVFCLHNTSIKTLDVPQTSHFYRFLDEQAYAEAYAIACLGVTESDWRALALASLKSMDFDIARKAFVHIREWRYLNLIATLEQQERQNQLDVGVAQADILAYEGQFSKAASMYAKSGDASKAITMFTELRMWEEAKAFAAESGTGDVADLVQRQANWAAEVHDWRAAAEMYAASGNFNKAIDIIGERKWYGELMELARKLDAREYASALRACARYLVQGAQYRDCREVYLKLGDVESLMKLHMDLQEWEEAVTLAKQNPGRFAKELFLPYAEWLSGQDRFEEALDAYEEAGRQDHSIMLLLQLAQNAVSEFRYAAAAYFHFRLAQEHFDLGQIKQAGEHERSCDAYFAYQYVYAYTEDPFMRHLPQTLFYAAQYLTNVIGKQEAPLGMSKARVLYTLAMQAMKLEAFKLARVALEKLQHLVCPHDQWTDQIEFCIITLQTKPFLDREDLIPIDYRSSTVNPMLHPSGSGDCCVQTNAPFVRSFLTFDLLPLVEFQPHPSISHTQALAYMQEQRNDKSNNSMAKKARSKSQDGWKERDHGQGIQSLQLDDEDEDVDFDTDNNHQYNDGNLDLFAKACSRQPLRASSVFQPLILDAPTLQSLNIHEVFIWTYPGTTQGPRYFKNVIPDIAIHSCSQCRHFFHQDDFYFESLQQGQKCPICHLSTVNSPEKTELRGEASGTTSQHKAEQKTERSGSVSPQPQDVKP